MELPITMLIIARFYFLFLECYYYFYLPVVIVTSA